MTDALCSADLSLGAGRAQAGGSLASPQKPGGGREPVRRGRLVLTGDCGEVLWVINCVSALTVVRDPLSDIARLKCALQ